MAEYTLNHTASEIDSILSSVHLVGSIFLTTNSANPSTYFGFGTWVSWGSGRVPVGVNASDTNFNTVEKTGGASTHTLTTAQMPAHSHTVTGTAASACAHTHTTRLSADAGSAMSGSSNDYLYKNDSGGTYLTTSSSGAHTHSVSGTAVSSGSGGAHNNLQPYITCYMWKRTA